MSRPNHKSPHQGRTTMSKKALGHAAPDAAHGVPTRAELIAAGVNRAQRRQAPQAALSAAVAHPTSNGDAPVAVPVLAKNKRVLFGVLAALILVAAVGVSVVAGAFAPAVGAIAVLAGFAGAVAVAVRPDRFHNVGRIGVVGLAAFGVAGGVGDATIGGGPIWAMSCIVAGVLAAVIVRTAAKTFSPAAPLPGAVQAIIRTAGAQLIDLGGSSGSMAVFPDGRAAVVGSANGIDPVRDADIQAFAVRMGRIRNSPGGGDLEGICILSESGHGPTRIAEGVWSCSGSNFRKTVERLRR